MISMHIKNTSGIVSYRSRKPDSSSPAYVFHLEIALFCSMKP